jgi:hypothetical protein
MSSNLAVIFRAPARKMRRAASLETGRGSETIELKVFIGIADRLGKSSPLDIRDSNYYWPFRVVSGFGSDVFHAFLPVGTQEIETQAIFGWVDFCYEFRS